MFVTAERMRSGLLLLIFGGIVILAGHGCTKPSVRTQSFSKPDHLSLEELRVAALKGAAQRGLLRPERRYVVYFRALDENSEVAEAQFIASEVPTFDFPRLKINARTGEALEPSLQATHTSADAPPAAKPVILTNSPAGRGVDETSIRDLAVDIMAREELPRNIPYNMEYRWSADGQQLEVWFRPVWRESEVSGVVRMTFSAELNPEEE